MRADKIRERLTDDVLDSVIDELVDCEIQACGDYRAYLDRVREGIVAALAALDPVEAEAQKLIRKMEREARDAD